MFAANDLFGVACERVLEDIVAKRARGSYRTDGRLVSRPHTAAA
jgi:ATP-dependent DNA ligase